MVKKEEPPWNLTHIVTVFAILFIDYFFLGKLGLNSTIEMAIGFLIYTVVIGIFVYFYEIRPNNP